MIYKRKVSTKKRCCIFIWCSMQACFTKLTRSMDKMRIQELAENPLMIKKSPLSWSTESKVSGKTTHLTHTKIILF